MADLMNITAINNPFAKKVGAIQGANKFSPVEAIRRVDSGSNPFAKNDDGMVGIGIKDGAIQTSNGQLGKPVAQMRQLGIA